MGSQCWLLTERGPLPSVSMECGAVVVETGFPEFTTFSVGEGEDRRTVVCFQQQLLEFTLGNHQWEKARDTGEYLSIGENLSMGETEVEGESLVVKPSDLVNNVPISSHVSIGMDNSDSFSAKDNSCKQINAFENFTLSYKQSIVSDTENYFEPASTLKHSVQYHESSAEPSPSGTPTKKPSKRSKSKRPERAVYVPPRGRGKPLSPNAMEFKPNNVQHILANELPIVSASVTPSVPVRDVTAQVVDEITTAVGGVQIESPSVDYKSYQTSDSTININQFGHVIEIYDFPQQMKTSDLMAAFQAFASRWDIKWVDDTHALGVFSSAEVAAEALAMRHPNIKSRPLNMATAQSKCKAKAVCEYLLPYKPRPATSTAPARRLLQWALGSDKKVPAASKAEQDRLRDAIKRKEEDKRKRREELILEDKRREMIIEPKNYGEHDDR